MCPGLKPLITLGEHIVEGRKEGRKEGKNGGSGKKVILSLFYEGGRIQF